MTVFSKKRFFLYLPAIIVIIAVLGSCVTTAYLNARYPIEGPNKPYDRDLFTEYHFIRLNTRNISERVFGVATTVAALIMFIILVCLEGKDFVYVFVKGTLRLVLFVLLLVAITGGFTLLDPYDGNRYTFLLFTLAVKFVPLYFIFVVRCIVSKIKAPKANGIQ